MNKVNSINHLSIILDGNKRWAKNKKIPIIDAYGIGIQNVLDISKELLNKKIKYFQFLLYQLKILEDLQLIFFSTQFLASLQIFRSNYK